MSVSAELKAVRISELPLRHFVTLQYKGCAFNNLSFRAIARQSTFGYNANPKRFAKQSSRLLLSKKNLDGFSL